MVRSEKIYNIILFSLYFLFLWMGQLSSARVAFSGNFFNLWTILMYLCLFSRGGLWVLILKEMNLIKAYALSSVNFLIIPLLSRFFLHESLEPKYLIGAFFIIPGIFLFALGEKRNSARRMDVVCR